MTTSHDSSAARAVQVNKVGPVIDDWRPEDPEFWASCGKRVATRNLWISIPALLLAFAVWMVWSTVIVRLNAIGFNFGTDQLFWLTALPALSGATFRVFYSFMVPVFGGRRWTAISTASLLIPAIWMGIAVQNPDTPYSVFVLIALLCGFGGGNFASSMSNISFFYPKSQQGMALGLNAGLGNLGVSVMQFSVPLVIGFSLFGGIAGAPQELKDGTQLWLQNAGYIWVPLIVLVTLAAWFGMNDLSSAKASFNEQSIIFKRKHNWIMCWLYLATFGSFIGFAAAFPMLIKTSFPEVNALKFAFLGPFVGALVRPLGGWVSDRMGGARVTFWNFVLMIAAVLGVLHFLPQENSPGSFYGFLVMFMLLFVTTGIGNGSTFRMIPVIFRTLHQRWSAGKSQAEQALAMQEAGKESAAVIGFTSAVGAFGGFFIPIAFATSMTESGRPEVAMYIFISYYLSCIAVTWWWYSRKGAQTPC
ncbi:NarK family nitrate/nitrite MFS transporter [Pseudomonas sp.]|uniref:NarK family nitrate/nitrite MFS transporter n=1 Tax=Pseudomonas sp. TaxID=306 RepID=UPI003A984C03